MHHIQIDLRILVVQVQRRRHQAVADAEHGQNRFQCAHRADRMSQCGFRRVDRGVVTDGLIDRVRLGGVADRGRGRMGVDVGDVLGRQTRGLYRPRHRPGGTVAIGGGSYQMITVGSDSSAEQARVDRRAAGLGVLLGLDDHQRTGLAEDETVAILVEWTRGALRIVVAGAHRAHHGECRDRHRVDETLHATGDDHIGITHDDHSPRVGNGLGAR